MPFAFLVSFLRCRLLLILFVSAFVLWMVFEGGLVWLWLSLPKGGIRLHGTVAGGVDLLGGRNELGWLGGLGMLVLTVNSLLAWYLWKKESVASYYLLAAMIPVYILFIAVVIFLADLNNLIF